MSGPVMPGPRWTHTRGQTSPLRYLPWVAGRCLDHDCRRSRCECPWPSARRDWLGDPLCRISTTRVPRARVTLSCRSAFDLSVSEELVCAEELVKLCYITVSHTPVVQAVAVVDAVRSDERMDGTSLYHKGTRDIQRRCGCKRSPVQTCFLLGNDNGLRITTVNAFFHRLRVDAHRFGPLSQHAARTDPTQWLQHLQVRLMSCQIHVHEGKVEKMEKMEKMENQCGRSGQCCPKLSFL
mmetsp:Transcript_39715/g.102204  ORF Transcript_39715/g.102204 Transcript_39715/m.102204 type:complete len:238 (+) Transcript_39715:2078-2791(+)